MSIKKFPISKIPGTSENKGYRVRPYLLNPNNGKKEQVCVQDVEWTEQDAVREYKRLINLGPLFFNQQEHQTEREKEYKENHSSKSNYEPIYDINGQELITFHDLFESFIRNNSKGNRESYLEGHIINYNAHIKNVLGNKKLTELRKTDVAQWKITLNNHTIKKSGRGREVGDKLKNISKNRIIVTMRNLLEYGYENFDLKIQFEIQPFKKGADEKRRPVVYSIEKLAKFLSAIDKEDVINKTFFTLLVAEGIRFSEARALRESDFDFENKTVLIRHNISRKRGYKGWIETPPKNNEVRLLHIGDNTIKVVQDFIDVVNKEYGYNSNTHYLFGGLEPYSPNMMQTRFRKIREKACAVYPELDKRLAIHDIRHSVASYVATYYGAEQAREQLGHRDISVTSNYIHVELSKDGVNDIDKLIGQVIANQ